MKERPILFHGAMVRALLAGTKTQTRRAVKPQPVYAGGAWKCADGSTHQASRPSKSLLASCPYGQPGDRLWVRENGWERPERTPKMMREGADTWAPYYYDADGILPSEAADFKAWGFKRRPSIHMPRRACRLVLEITGVRVERLWEISDADVQAEGCDGYKLTYAKLWESINGPGSWDANPWVWVVQFRRLP